MNHIDVTKKFSLVWAYICWASCCEAGHISVYHISNCSVIDSASLSPQAAPLGEEKGLFNPELPKIAHCLAHGRHPRHDCQVNNNSGPDSQTGLSNEEECKAFVKSPAPKLSTFSSCCHLCLWYQFELQHPPWSSHSSSLCSTPVSLQFNSIAPFPWLNLPPLLEWYNVHWNIQQSLKFLPSH